MTLNGVVKDEHGTVAAGIFVKASELNSNRSYWMKTDDGIAIDGGAALWYDKFNNKWTIGDSSYLGSTFGRILLKSVSL